MTKRKLTKKQVEKLEKLLQPYNIDVPRIVEVYNNLRKEYSDLMDEVIVGLFGTCGDSTWRLPIIAAFKILGIKFFNPHKKGWSPDDAKIEAKHLAEDDIILFPITSETYGQGSLSEVGLSLMSALKLNSSRYFNVHVSRDLDPELTDKDRRKDSLTSRALVCEHLKQFDKQNKITHITYSKNTDHMLAAVLEIYPVAIKDKKIQKMQEELASLSLDMKQGLGFENLG